MGLDEDEGGRDEEQTAKVGGGDRAAGEAAAGADGQSRTGWTVKCDFFHLVLCVLCASVVRNAGPKKFWVEVG